MITSATHGSRFGLTALALAAAVTLAANPAAAEADPTGVWIDHTGRGAVEIAACGKALCGKVVWVKSEKDRKGCGEQIIGSVKSAGQGMWDSGWIYSPDHGRKFDVELKPVGADKLRVVGFAGIRLFSETHYWKRAPADLARCDNVQTAAAAPADGKTLTDAALETAAPVAAAAATPAKAAATAATASPATAKPTAGGTTKVASADTTAEDDEPAPKRKGGSGFGGLPVEKYLKKKGNTCKLNTPWFKVDFDCKGL